MKTIIIGRDESCDIVVNNPVVSRKHAMLRIHPLGKVELIDMSQNGVKVNGTKIKKGVPCPVSRTNSITIAEVYQLDWSMIPNYALYVKLATIVVVVLLLSALGWYCYERNTSTEVETEQIKGQSYESPQGEDIIKNDGKVGIQSPGGSEKSPSQPSDSLDEKESGSNWVDGFVKKEKEKKEKAEKKKKQKTPTKSDSNKKEKEEKQKDSVNKTIPEIII